MPFYDYRCPKCEEVYEIRHEMSCTDEFFCTNHGKKKVKLEKQISSTFYISSGMGPTIADQKEMEHTKKVKDPERAIRMRKKAFGKDSVGDPSMKTDPKHIVKRGRTLGGQQKDIDKTEFIKASARDQGMVNAAQQALKKARTK